MGNTTRRQPITHSIPAAPNYKFLNITDFRGLNITDNPFTAQPNTASDCLNVYVDENNALSTRPRLEKRINFATNGYSVVNVYPINSGYLVHRKKDGVYSMWIAKNENLANPIQVGGRTPTSIAKLRVFEQNDVIYFLDGYDIYNIKNDKGVYTLSRLEPYIPTVYGGLSFGEYGVDNLEQIEPLNLLTDKYKETYFWDGVSEIKISNPEVESVENKYFVDKYTNGNNLIQDDIILAYNTENKSFVIRGKTENLRDDSEFPDVPAYYVYRYEESPTNKNALDGGRCYYLNDGGEEVYIVLPYDQELYQSTVSGDGNTIIINTPTETIGYFHTSNLNSNEYVRYTAKYNIGDCEKIELSYEGYYLTVTTTNNVSVNGVARTTEGDVTQITFDLMLSLSASNYIVSISKDSKRFIVIQTLNYNNTIYIFNDVKYDTLLHAGDADATIKDDKLVITSLSDISLSTNDFAITSEGSVLIIRNLDSDTPEKLYLENANVKQFTFADGLNYAYGKQNNNLIIFPNIINNDYSFYNTYYKPTGGKVYYDVNDILINFGGNSDSLISSLLKYEDNHEPNVIATNKISVKNKEYSKFSENSPLVRKAKLYTRFDNKIWLAHKNRLFYSNLDNMNYFPLLQFDIIGDDTDVTGFNLASDELLIVYKNNSICTVYPTTVNNKLTYIFADSKNTIGNDAIGNTIVSTLTERPLQITKNGIYALKQIENIESNSRISELISEPINKKWLQESDYVPQCITMNRLYWTYFILPYDKYTKVYLLDNRTSSWYYWELPVVTINAFVKDDKSMIVSSNGRLYSLETTDTISIHNPDTTEYYDDDRKLIKWYWTSQILPLGTINYSKRLVDTTFIVADTDTSDSYALNYKFKTYRKLASESNATTITNRLNYIQSTTKKTLIPRFNFIQIEISNVEEDAAEALDNNKIRLVGLGLKYILLEALI